MSLDTVKQSHENDARINLQPLRIIDHGGSVDGAIDVVEKAKLLDHEFKEGPPPLTNVALVHGEDDRGWFRQRRWNQSDWPWQRAAEEEGLEGSGYHVRVKRVGENHSYSITVR
jgi:hypothetical protein